jgi:hypothetical protein
MFYLILDFQIFKNISNKQQQQQQDMNSCVFKTTRVKTVKFDFNPSIHINSHNDSVLHDIKNEQIMKNYSSLINDKKRPSKKYKLYYYQNKE